MRPLLHLAPRRGWLNDPNGLIQWRGLHHMFFQFDPVNSRPRRLHWGHATSADLTTWIEHPVALSPDSPYDADGCFSGCAVALEDRVALIYTGVQGQMQLPCLAHSDDDELLSFTKDPGNPVIRAWPEPDVTDFRDHAVWRDGTAWRQVIGGGTRSVGGAAFGYASNDLRHWTYDQIVADAAHSPIAGPVWECPDLFRIIDTDVLVVSLILDSPLDGPEVWWMSGQLAEGRLVPTASGVVDVGDRFYAPQSYWADDGRRLMFGWLRTHQDPASAGDPYVGVMSLPRQLRVQDGQLLVDPADELKALRGKQQDTDLTDAGETAITVEDRVTGELVLDATAAARVTSITLTGADGQIAIDCTRFADSGGALTLYWDAGIVEVFRGGLAGAWTDLRVEWVSEVRLHQAGGTGGAVTAWDLHPEQP
jgi:beta-fructofuranosidase